MRRVKQFSAVGWLFHLMIETDWSMECVLRPVHNMSQDAALRCTAMRCVASVHSQYRVGNGKR